MVKICEYKDCISKTESKHCVKHKKIIDKQSKTITKKYKKQHKDPVQ